MKPLFYLFITYLLTVFLACNNNGTKTSKVSTSPIEISRDSTRIAYTDSKIGDTTLFFVHGWNINKEYWSNQVAYFSKKYRTVSIDLPGFGESGKNRKKWSVEEYGKDINEVISKLDLKNVILIGHSMSGAIVVVAAINNPTRVIGVVGIDNFTNYGSGMTPELKKEIAESYKAMRSNYKDLVIKNTNQTLFSTSTDSSTRKRVLHDFLNVDTAASVSILEANDLYPLDSMVQKLGKTLYLLNSNFHPTDTTGFVKDNVPFKLLYVGPTGHYPMIENPVEFNNRLDEVIQAIRANESVSR